MAKGRKRTSTSKKTESEPKRRKEEKTAEEPFAEPVCDTEDSEDGDGSKWERRPLPAELGKSRPIAMQVLDVETYVDSGRDCDRTNVKLYGITREGVSVCIVVTDYFPYFYFQAPASFRPEHIELAQRNLNNALSSTRRGGSGGKNRSAEEMQNVVHLKIVQGQNLYYYKETKETFIKVSGTQPTLNKAKQELKKGVDLTDTGLVQVGVLFEAIIDGDIKFMAHTGVVGCGWVEVPVSKGSLVPEKSMTSRCQLEATCSYKDLIVHSVDGDWADIAPFRTLSFDIECLGRRGVFPDPEHDSIIQISNTVKLQGEAEPFIRICFVLGTCAAVTGSQIIECKTEKELLERWAEFVRLVDPDILTGYNILNFDLPYILNRAKILRLSLVSQLGRQKDRESVVREAKFSSRQMGSRVNKIIDIHGRVIFDVYQRSSLTPLHSDPVWRVLSRQLGQPGENRLLGTLQEEDHGGISIDSSDLPSRKAPLKSAS